MPYALLRIYAEELVELVAEEALEAMTISDMPYMKDADRAKVRDPYVRALGGSPNERGPLDKEAVVPDAPLDPKAKHAAEVARRFGIAVDPGIES